MRIECEKCGAAFAIDEKLVPAKGVRAQCPKCRNIQLVHRAEPPAAAVQPAAAQKNAPSVAPPPPVHTPESGVPAQIAQTLKAKAASGRSAAPGDVRSKQTERSATVARADPQQAGPSDVQPKQTERNATEARRSGEPGSAPKAATLPRAAPARAYEDPPTDEVAICGSCGKPLADAFDRALGTCDSCRAEGPVPPHVPPSKTTSPPAAAKPKAGQPLTAARPDSQRRMRPFVVGGLGVTLLAGAAAMWLLKPSAPERPIDKPVPAAVMTVLPRWKLSFMGLSGKSEDHLKAANAAMQLDTPSGYLAAEESFQKGLLLNPDSDAAIIGYVRALSLGRGVTLDESSFNEALLLIDAARSRSNDAPHALVAEAQLRLTRTGPEQLEKARALAERALKSDDALAQAEAHIILGRTYVETSLALALQHFDRAVVLAPQLTRVQLFRAHAYEESGDVQKALAALKERLNTNPDHSGALEALSRLYQESGDTDAAREVYQRVLEQRRGDFRANLMLAVLKYQAESKPQEAVKALASMAKDKDRYDERDQLELLTHLAAAQRAAGDLDAARTSADRAIAITAADPGAHLQSLLVALDEELAAEAARHLPFVEGHLGDPGLERVLRARVKLAEGRAEEAARVFKDAVRIDARRTDALIMAGVALAVANKREQALTALAPLESADPLRTAPRSVVSRFYLPLNDTLRSAGRHVLKLSRSEDDVTPRVYQGLIHWHRGELPEAAKLFNAVIASDPRNVAAQAYLALIEERRGDFQKAKQSAERAVAADKRNAIAQYALGAALQGLGDRDGAAKAFQQAEAFSPSLIAASLRVAQLEAAAGKRDRARERLSRLLHADPNYLPAKQTLYVLSIAGGSP